MLNGLRHDMGSRMTERPAPVRVLKGQKFYRAVLRQRRRQIYGLSVQLRRQNLLRKAVADRLYKIKNFRPLFDFADAAVLQRDFQHNHNLHRHIYIFQPLL